jgi:hypothetical protein
VVGKLLSIRKTLVYISKAYSAVTNARSYVFHVHKFKQPGPAAAAAAPP